MIGPGSNTQDVESKIGDHGNVKSMSHEAIKLWASSEDIKQARRRLIPSVGIGMRRYRSMRPGSTP